MAVAAWAASTAFAVGDIRRATTVQATGLWFRCTTAGTSGSSEPNWPTDVGNTTNATPLSGQRLAASTRS